MSIKQLPILIIIVISQLLLCTVSTYASTITPPTKEIMITSSERVSEKVVYLNNTNENQKVSPKIFTYDPQKEELIDNQEKIFIRMDKEIYDIDAGKSQTFEYEIIPPSNLTPGSYFNLIVFERIKDEELIKENNSVGAVDNMSHLIVLHITDPESTSIKGITSNFAQISMEIIDNGVPYLKPTRIKYVYQNTSNYVLKPEGEIQVFSTKGGYSPIYLKINAEGKKLYPQNTIEEIVEVNEWHIQDLIYKRNIVGRFYNGLDENIIVKESVQQPFYYIVIFVGIFLVLIFILVKSVREDNRKKTK